ncbi:hypothetical protein [Nocardia otitidiscaviarum]|uniref:hypothetical protein n=1 Tax=Nocardia otitidiscaviarum TaxID=1823 RepID=UPI001E29DAFC|nr:hypothetical protein [Nocardia otitidiscaviarum]
MARRREFFAELQHQQRLAQQRQAQQQRAAMRAHTMAVREAQRHAREQERAAAAAIRASSAERAAAEKAAKLAHIAAREAVTEEKNAQLAATYDAIAHLLDATLEVDDWVDLESLRESATDPPFDRPDLLSPVPAPRYQAPPDRPIFVPPAPPTGISGALGGNRRHAAQMESAHREYLDAVRQWELILVRTCAVSADLRAGWRQKEAERVAELEQARRRLEHAGAERRRQVDESNARLDRLIAGLRERRPDAMEEYVGIVLANSVYPESFEVSYEYSFAVSDRELSVTVLAPHPDAFPTTKTFRYNKTTDEITETPLPTAEVKRRYAAAIAQTALRTAHEVFEADREQVIDSIALTVAVDAVDAATGHDTRIDLVRLATDRADFLSIDLARVDPAATLAHLSAAVSKNPHGLTPLADHGVRG